MTTGSITLHNGAVPLMWQARPGGDGLRPFVGTVLASLPHNERHPWVVWAMASDDNDLWDCFGGDYHTEYEAAQKAFADRRVLN
tara:strand:- start:188 stop:439 length:252 start_codon:yes stop_codon:yes gene_type:complete